MLTNNVYTNLIEDISVEKNQEVYEQTPVQFGLISVIYDFNGNVVFKNFLDILSFYKKIIKANLQVPIESHFHLELIVVKGDLNILNRIITTFESIEAVKTVKFEEINNYTYLK